MSSLPIVDLDMAPNVAAVIVAVYGLLIVASAFTWSLARRRPEKDYSELRARVRTWWVIVTLFAVAIALKPIFAICLLGFMSFLAFKEYITLIPTRRADHRVLFWASSRSTPSWCCPRAWC
jgi:phosphatidate cytidylyltransferase